MIRGHLHALPTGPRLGPSAPERPVSGEWRPADERLQPRRQQGHAGLGTAAVGSAVALLDAGTEGHKAAGRVAERPAEQAHRRGARSRDAGARPGRWVDYLAAQAEKNPAAFMALLGKVLPLQVTGGDDGPLIIQWINYADVEAGASG